VEGGAPGQTSPPSLASTLSGTATQQAVAHMRPVADHITPDKETHGFER
jgi:hypothetical protein